MYENIDAVLNRKYIVKQTCLLQNKTRHLRTLIGKGKVESLSLALLKRAVPPRRRLFDP